MEPSPKRPKVRSYVTWTSLREPLHPSRWCHGKWHPYFRPQEGIGCLDYIQPFPHISPHSRCKEGFHCSAYDKKNLTRINRDNYEQLYAPYVPPPLEYASSFVHSGLQMDVNCLKWVQRAATRSVRSMQKYPYEESVITQQFNTRSQKKHSSVYPNNSILPLRNPQTQWKVKRQKRVFVVCRKRRHLSVLLVRLYSFSMTLIKI